MQTFSAPLFQMCVQMLRIFCYFFMQRYVVKYNKGFMPDQECDIVQSLRWSNDVNVKMQLLT